jgi:hypothetical protein
MTNKQNKANKNANKIKGRGVYNASPAAPLRPQTYTKQPSVGRRILSGAGAAIGQNFGGPLGGFIGGSLGGIASTILGFGTYKVKKNSLTPTQGRAGGVPFMHSSNETVTVRHREYICDITTSGSVNTFNAQSFNLNPGLSATFPYLSGIASNFTEYTWKGLAFDFVSTSGESVSSTTTSLPSVMLATQYRSTASPFTSKQAMLNEYFSDDGKASDDIMHFIECDPKENPYNVQYIRTSSVPAGEDGKSYDMGLFTIATTGCQAGNVVVGELWATYDVELRKPFNGIQLGYTVPTTHYYDTTASTAAPFGTSAVVRWNGLGATLTTTVCTVPAGNPGIYMIILSYPAATAMTQSGTSFGNATAYNIMGATDNVNYMEGISSANGTGQIFCWTVTVTDSTKLWTFTPSVTITGATGVELWIMQLNNNTA